MENNSSIQSETDTDTETYRDNISTQGCFLSNGEESDETKFMCDFFLIYDKFSHTDLLTLFKNAIANGNSKLELELSIQSISS